MKHTWYKEKMGKRQAQHQVNRFAPILEVEATNIL